MSATITNNSPYERAATDYCTSWRTFPTFTFLGKSAIPTGNTIRRRPRHHPQVPHPGTGPGAIRATCRLMAKEALLQQQAQARATSNV